VFGHPNGGLYDTITKKVQDVMLEATKVDPASHQDDLVQQERE